MVDTNPTSSGTGDIAPSLTASVGGQRLTLTSARKFSDNLIAIEYFSITTGESALQNGANAPAPSRNGRPFHVTIGSEMNTIA